MSIDREQLKEEIIHDEGVVYYLYNDHLDNKTFGIGHLVTKNDPEWNMSVGTRILTDRVHSVFETDLNIAIMSAFALYKDFETWPRVAKHVLINMIFNLGKPKMRLFVNMNAALNQHNWKEAAIHGRDSRWYRQVTNRAERLMRRLESI